MLLPLFPAGAALVDAHAFSSLTVGTLLAWLLATPVQFGCAAGLYRKAYKSLRAGAPGMEVGAPPAGQSLYFFHFSTFYILHFQLSSSYRVVNLPEKPPRAGCGGWPGGGDASRAPRGNAPRGAASCQAELPRDLGAICGARAGPARSARA
jgi:hypothetical protein